MEDSEKRIRYAVVGAGNIAQVAVLPAFAHAKENSELVALISSDPEKQRVLGERYDITELGGYDELEKVLERAQVDAVYVCTPNSEHREYAVRAADQGVHVLCEKPLATSVEDCQLMFEACERNGVYLMTAYRLHFEGANLKALEIARSGQLGQLRLFSSFFSHVVRSGDIRRDPELGGGACFDLGVYCINAARTLFDSEPIEVFANIVERNGTDDTATVLLKFPGERLAQFSVSNSVAGVSSYRIAGAKGDLRVEPAYEYAEGNEHYLTIDESTKKESFKKRDQFAPELVYFSRCILEQTAPEPSAEEGACDVRVVEAILSSARSGKPVTLAPYQRSQRPSPDQEMKKPAVKKPETVNAPGPSVR
ncbi:MAG: Gfo/Idh/MocA family oxidoreductase [Polyangiaceae bacterium]